MSSVLVPSFSSNSAPGSLPVDGSSTRRVEAMVRDHLGSVWRTAGDLGIAPRDRDDVAQEVLLVAMRRVEDIEAGRERAFLLATTVRVAANWRRQGHRRPLHLTASMDEGLPVTIAETRGFVEPDKAAEQNQELSLVHKAMGSMTEPQRVAFSLFELEQLSAREIAGELGLTEAVVFARVRRARATFRKYCEMHGHGANKGVKKQ